MAVREIKTTLALDGEQEYKRALGEAQRSIRVMSSELKAAQAEFEATGDAQAYYVSRGKTLRAQIAQQEEIIRSLTVQVEQSAKAYGDADKRTDEYRIKLNNATVALNRMRKQLSDTDREAEELGRDSSRVGRQIEDGIGDAADRTERDLKSMFAQLQSDIGDIRGSVTISAIADVGGAIGDIYSQISGLAEGTREERRSEAFLHLNARRAGLDVQRLDSLLIELVAVHGEKEAVIEGLNNLIKMGIDDQELAEIAVSLMDMYMEDPKTLSYEGLADSVQESSASGTPTGQFAEAVSRSTLSEDELKEAMESAGTPDGWRQIVMAYIRKLATGRMEEFKTDPETSGLYESGKVQEEWNQEVMELGGNVDEKIVTPAKEWGTGFLKGFNTFSEYGFGGLFEQMQQEQEAMAQAAAAEMANVDAYTAGMRAKAAALESQAQDAYLAGDMLAYHKMTAEKDRMMEDITETTQFVAERQAELQSIEEQLAELEGKADKAEAEGLTATAEDMRATEEELTARAESLRAELQAKWQEVGADAMTGMEEGAAEAAEGATQAMHTIGANYSRAVGNGIAEEGDYAVGQAAAVADGVLAEYARIESAQARLARGVDNPVAGYAGRGSASGGQVNVSLNLDGRTVARATAPYMDSALAQRTDRAMVT